MSHYVVIWHMQRSWRTFPARVSQCERTEAKERMASTLENGQYRICLSFIRILGDCGPLLWRSAIVDLQNSGTVPSPHHHRFTALFRDHQGEPVPEENFKTLWCKGRLTEAETQTIRLSATPSGLTSAHLHHPPFYRPDALPAAQPTATKHWRQLAHLD